MADIPDGVTLSVAEASIAWEIVKLAEHNSPNPNPTLDKLVRNMTNAYIKAYRAIHEGKPIEEEK